MTKRHIRLLAGTLYHQGGETLEVVESEAAVCAAPQHKILMAHAERLVQRGEAEWVGSAPASEWHAPLPLTNPDTPLKFTNPPRKKRTGPKPLKKNAAVNAMLSDLRSGKLTRQQLEADMLDKQLVELYGTHGARSTLRQARVSALDWETQQTSPKKKRPTNNDK